MLFIFDMGGVVTNTAGRALDEEISKRLGISTGEFHEICAKGSENGLLSDIETGLKSIKEFWTEFSKLSGISVCADWFRLLFHPKLNDETVKVIDFIKSVPGSRIVCGTNTIESHYDNHMSRGDYSFFEMTYASHHMGVKKPDPRFFEMILDAENERAENAFFTDDKKENCESACRIGIDGKQFFNAETLMKDVQAFIAKRS